MCWADQWKKPRALFASWGSLSWSNTFWVNCELLVRSRKLNFLVRVFQFKPFLRELQREVMISVSVLGESGGAVVWIS